MRMGWCSGFLLVLAWLNASGPAELRSAEAPAASASSASAGGLFPAGGALDGDRFSVAAGSAWAGSAGATSWWWQVRFPEPRTVGAILQIVGEHDFALRQAPRRYVWQGSDDGVRWQDWGETATADERRLFRVHRLHRVRRAQFVRLTIEAVTGQFPVLREVEFLAEPKAPVSFPDWIIAVNTTHEPKVPGHGQAFIPLARACAGWEKAPAQQIWLDHFDPAFISAEPRPLCAFLSGNFKDWCEVDRRLWRGTQTVLRSGRLPMWASCGGAQGLALLSEYGVDRPWDCPHCRDPARPHTPLYGHIGHTAPRPCGDYSGCVFERGPHWVQQLGDDPVFRGLPRDLELMESHCGQIEWPPRGWALIATAGPGTRTTTQCLRFGSRYIYAAQFHIEMAGTPEVSRRIMGNFLALAQESGRRPAK